MSVETDTERTTMIADFGVSVTWSPGDTYPYRNDSTADIKGVFDNEFFELVGQDTRARSSQPMIVCKTSDVSAAAHNSMIEIATDKYKVVGVEPDGTGITLLLLEGPRR